MGRAEAGDTAVSDPRAGSELAGRNREVDLIRCALDDFTEADVGQMVTLIGSAGVGKSRLCRVAEELAEQRDVVVIGRATWAGSGAPPLWPWIEAIRSVEPSLAEDLPTGEFARYRELLRRFERLVEREGPTMIVLDDLHLADAETIRFGRFVSNALHDMKLLVFISMRDAQQVHSRAAAALLSSADVAIRLAELDARAAHELLDAYPGLTAHERRRCHQLGAGNPLLLHEAARMVADGAETMSISTEQMLIDSVADWSIEQRATLDAAAVIGRVASVGEVAAACDLTPLEVLDVAESADFLGGVQTGQLEFRHDLIRQTVLAVMRPDVKVGFHRRITLVLADAELLSDVLRRADHAVAAAPASADDAAIAVEACRSAARRLQHGRSLDRAAEFMRRAAEVEVLHPVVTRDSRLAVDVAEAVLAAGHLAEARLLFARAAELAELSNDVVSLGRSALGLGGVWVEEERGAVERTNQLSLLRQSGRRLDSDQRVLSARIGVRLAAEQVYDGSTSVEEVAAAVDEVRQLGDDHALAEALSLQHHVLLGPDHAHDRFDLANELIDAAERCGSSLFGLMGRCWKSVDLFLLGDERAEASFLDFREHAEALECRSMEYIVAVLDVMRLFRRGALAEAEQGANDAFALGIDVGDADAMAYLGGQVVAISWARGRFDELRPMLDDLATSPTLKKLDAVFPAVSAAAAASAGDRESADQWLKSVGRGQLSSLAHNSTWLGTMAVLTEAARSLDDRALAAEILTEITPYRDLPVRPSLAVVCLGPTSRLVGVLNAVLGDHDSAIEALRSAVTDCERLGNVVAGAITTAELADLLLDRGGDENRDEGLRLLDQAIGAGKQFSLDHRVEDWERRAAEQSVPEQPSHVQRSATLTRQGTTWIFEIDGRRVIADESVGLHHLAELLRRPDQPIRATDLAGAIDGLPPETWSLGPISDEQARRTYGARVTDLESDIEQARANNDLERVAQLNNDFDRLVAHLAAVTGRFGGPRADSSSAERARMRVSKAIRRSIDRIRQGDDLLGRELARCVSTGRECCYSTDPVAPREWAVQTG